MLPGGADLSQSHVCALQDGRFLVVWNDEDLAPVGFASANTVYGRLFNADGTTDSDAFIIDQIFDDDLLATGAPRAAQLADGRVVVTYSEGFLSDPDIKTKILDPRLEGVVIAGSPFSDDHIGTGFDDNFVLGSGHDKVAAGGGSDQLFGGLGNDTLLGEADNDIIDGGLGNDTLNGGAGIDTMDGRGGNDLYSVDNASDIVTEAQGAGTDQVNASVSYTLAPGQEIETLSTSNTPGTAAINLTGNARANTLIGNAGANVLNGGAGNDPWMAVATTTSTSSTAPTTS